MSTLLDSTGALKKRALEVHLTEAEVTALVANGVVSLAQLAFAAAGPGQTASDEQIRNLFFATCHHQHGDPGQHEEVDI